MCVVCVCVYVCVCVCVCVCVGVCPASKDLRLKLKDVESCLVSELYWWCNKAGLHNLWNSGWKDKLNNYARFTRLRLNKLVRKYLRSISFFARNLSQDLPLGGGAECAVLLGRQFLSASLQPTLVQFGQMQFCIGRPVDNNNIIQTFPKKTRKCRVLLTRGGQLPQSLSSCAGMNGSAEGWTHSGLRSFSTVVRIAYCVLRQSGPSLL